MDSPTEGLEYQTETLSGITDANGTFEYREGETVTFYFGGSGLGQAEGDGDDHGKGRRRSIELSIEEIGVFFLAATMLVVLAFLMGWYGRGVALPSGSPRGRGIDPRRQAISQGAAHTLPQIEARGLGPRAMR